eukprot:3473275-Rhodomonas_salina.2
MIIETPSSSSSSSSSSLHPLRHTPSSSSSSSLHPPRHHYHHHHHHTASASLTKDSLRPRRILTPEVPTALIPDLTTGHRISPLSHYRTSNTAVLSPYRTSPSLSLPDIEYCGAISPYRSPRRVTITDRIPRS